MLTLRNPTRTLVRVETVVVERVRDQERRREPRRPVHPLLEAHLVVWCGESCAEADLVVGVRVKGRVREGQSQGRA